jgi:CRP-like cAMP-binding protein
MTAAIDDLSLTEQADEAFARGDFEEAFARYLTHLQQQPDNLYAWYLTAYLASQRGEQQAARGALNQVATALAESGQLLLALAACRNLARLDAAAAAAKVDEVARMYGAGSPMLERRRSTLPPPMPERVHVDLPDPDPGRGVEQLMPGALQALAATAMLWAERSKGPVKVPFHPLFSELEPADLASLVPLLTLRMMPGGAVVIEQGDEGRSFFVVVRGGVKVDRRTGQGQDVHLATLGSGAFFGEMAMLTDSPRVARVSCLHPTLLFELERETLERLAQRNQQVGRVLAQHTRTRLLRNLLATSPLFRDLDRVRRAELQGLFKTRICEPGQVVVREGDSSEGLHLVLSGAARVTRKDQGETLVLAELESGQIFGEMSMIQHRPATATVTAVGKTVLLVLARDDFNAHVGTYPEVLSHVYQLALEREKANLEIDRAPIVPVEESALLI